MPSHPPFADPERIAISKSSGVKIDWRGGHHSEYPLQWLRDECPCATCSGAHGEPTTSTKTASAANPFQMYRPALKMDEVEAVGNYAIRIVWNDGHSSGIYSYDYLRRICPCPECRAAQDQHG